MTEVQVSRLQNGLTVVTDHMASVQSVNVGIWVGTGTRTEEAFNNGAAHFLEHMAFKGTHNRSALDIALEVEAVGGHFNAYTARENTAYYVKVLRKDTRLAVDILSDILQNPTFDAEEFERERGVILQEIGQAVDTPDDIIFDHFQETAFPDQPMGLPILGTAPLIRSMKRQTLIDFMAAGYKARNMVLVATGAVDHAEIVDLAQEYFKTLDGAAVTAPEVGTYRGGDYREHRDCEQVHLLLGFPSCAYGAPEQFDTAVMANLLGGSMSSRLFQEIREKRGLAYSVYAYASAFTDSGLFGVYAGTGEDDVPDLMPVISDQLGNLAHSVTEDEVDRARAQLKASVLMGLESPSGRADQLGNQMLVYGRPWAVEELVEKIDGVTRDSVAKTADRVFGGTPTMTAIGPLSKLEGYDRLQERF